MFALTSVLGRPLAARYGVGVITLGAAVTGLGLAGLLIELWLSGSATRASELIGPMALVGLGNGLALPSLIGAVLSGVRSSRAGAASGVLTTAQQFSSAAGVALLGVVFFAALGPRAAPRPHSHGPGHDSQQRGRPWDQRRGRPWDQRRRGRRLVLVGLGGVGAP
ncbi:MAG: hypothetical protein ACRDZQ_11400 [Acidimicrobiales bacterium]